MQELFDSVARDGFTTAAAIRERIESSGIDFDDARLRTTRSGLEAQAERPIDRAAFTAIVGEELRMVSRIFERHLVIPDWQEFRHAVHLLYEQVAAERGGATADYIPILRDADPERWGVALCSVDGQRLSFGDVDIHHSIQSVSKPITYACALDREGPEFTHSFVGVEPSGRPFNSLDLLPDQRPFNPCVNAGAIMTAAVLASGRPDKSARQITQELMDLWAALCGSVGEVRFSEETMLSERATADTNFAIAYLLRGGRGLPRDVDLNRMMDVYLSCCSIELTATMLSVAAATLANGGVCPLNGVQVLPTEVVKKTLVVMQSAGMYDNAGHFTLEVGLPAKSGVAGAVLVVVPNLMGFATFSPRLDTHGNSVRGVAFCRELVERFTFHVYDSLSGGRTGCKQDPRESQYDRKQRDLTDLRWALAYGDRYAIQVRDLTLTCMIDICLADGEIREPELSAMADAYGAIIGSAIAPHELEALAEARRIEAAAPGAPSPFDDLLACLRREQARLDDNARELILEAAFRVACSDGQIDSETHGRLLAIAESLAVHPGVLELEIEHFRRRLTAT